ncbi:hypothetical protein BG006_011307 [Podila minutissima]|uniref:Sodium/nucleoside cotransporter n=1 Tax=Podila minutissima TaxID=64525 RepID=A0A9P5SU41_9FUNG|nr:hypothetical protein BG006_011307 [Podila minutissima]
MSRAHVIDDEKLDYIESQPPSDDEDQDNNFNSNNFQSDLSAGLHALQGHQQRVHEQFSDGAPIKEDDSSSISDSLYHGRFVFYHQHKTSIHHLLALLICTGLFIPAVVIHKQGNVLVLSLLYAAIVWWLIVQHLPEGTISGPNHRLISWQIVWTGIFMQYIIGLLIIRWTVGYSIFSFIAELAKDFLSFAAEGREFIFGPNSVTMPDGTIVPLASSFAVSVLPAIILFAAVIQCLYYYNIVQSVVAGMASFIIHIIDISGVECVAACAAPFVGMSEASMLVGPFVSEMTEAELHQVLTSGFATISGSVFLGLLTFGVDATALLTACMMSVPCAIVISKIRFPETEVPLTKGTAVAPAYKDRESNAIHAISNGAIFGIKLCIVVVAVLLAVISLLGLTNGILGWIFHFYGVEISIEKIASWVLYPLAWLIGIPSQDLQPAAEAMGIKFILNEFAAFAEFVKKKDQLQPRTNLLTTYAMASFANVGSIGAQISLFLTLAPDRADAIARLSFSACMCGAASTLISACIAGIVS